MSIQKYKEKILELQEKVDYLEKEMNKEIQIMFWRKFCKITDIDFVIADIVYKSHYSYFEYRKWNAQLIINDKKYDGFRLNIYNDYNIYKSGKSLTIKYTNSIKDIFKRYSTIALLDQLFNYIYKYSNVLQNTEYLSNLISVRTFMLCSQKIFPPNVSKIISNKILFF